MAAFFIYNCRMHHFLKHRRAYGLIVSIAITLNLFAPAISHAMATLTRDPLILEMCSVSTPASVSAAGDKQMPPASSAHTIKHCVFCATHTDAYASPLASQGLIAVLRGHDAYLAQYYQSPAPLSTWFSGQPRAPPMLA